MILHRILPLQNLPTISPISLLREMDLEEAILDESEQEQGLYHENAKNFQRKIHLQPKRFQSITLKRLYKNPIPSVSIHDNGKNSRSLSPLSYAINTQTYLLQQEKSSPSCTKKIWWLPMEKTPHLPRGRRTCCDKWRLDILHAVSTFDRRTRTW